MKRLFVALPMILLFLTPMLLFAQTPVEINPDQSFLSQVLGLIGQFGGLTWMAKVSSICLLIVASMKTTFIFPLWQKLPDLFKTLMAPFLALIGGITALGGGLTWASALAYVGTGAGAIIMHELLDGVKTIPGIGTMYVTIINIVEGLFAGPRTQG